MPEGFKGDAHALLVAVYRDTWLPLPIRIDAAKAAVKFEKTVLAATSFTEAENPDQPVPMAARKKPAFGRDPKSTLRPAISNRMWRSIVIGDQARTAAVTGRNAR